MHNGKFLPEGSLIHTEYNTRHTASREALVFAMENQLVIEGEVIMCDSHHNLTVEFPGYCGIIPRCDTALGIEEGLTRDIAVISRVGKPISCIVRGISDEDANPQLLLSRREAQKKALFELMHTLIPGDVIPARVTHLEPFGAFVDIGCGNISLIGIETLSVSRITHTKNRFRTGDDIFAVVTGLDFEKQRIHLSHRELLGTWRENADKFEIGQTVRGIVRGIEDYGIFVELAPSLSGLAELRDDVKIGDCVSVFIKSIISEKMKIKLIVIDVFPNPFERLITRDDYFITDGHIDRWQYSPEVCSKKNIVTEF